MDLLPALRGPWNPLRITGTPMPPSLLLMCKIIAVALLGTRHVAILPDPFLPFIPGLDELVAPAAFRLTLQAMFIAAAVALLFNRCVRASALVLGSCLLLAVVSSKAYYGNNKTFCGLALVLAGLSDFDRPAFLLRWQLALVYFGAALNKLLDEDWQSGLFFQYWGGEKIKDPTFVMVAGWLPYLVAGKIMCWGTILAEFAVSIGLLLPRFVPMALWLNVFFQVGLLEFTGTTFTLFFYGMLAANLAFIAWPERIQVYHHPNRPFFRVLRSLDFDHLQEWQPDPDGRRFQVVANDRIHLGFAGIRYLLACNPVVWLTLTAILAGLPGDAALARRLLVAGVLLFFLPLAWSRSATLSIRK